MLFAWSCGWLMTVCGQIGQPTALKAACVGWSQSRWEAQCAASVFLEGFEQVTVDQPAARLEIATWVWVVGSCE